VAWKYPAPLVYNSALPAAGGFEAAISKEKDAGLTFFSRITRGCYRLRRAHLIGVAGAGMRSLAEVLLGLGWKLSGSDLACDLHAELASAGVRVQRGHAAAHLPRATDLVIRSDAIRADNPELRRAVELGIPTLSYFEMIGRLMSGRRGLAVAGTHGKSTTTAMAAEILVSAGCDPTVFCGAAPLGRFSGGRAGRSELVLAEACEYRANFLHLHPQMAVILGIEPDHFDCYDSADRLRHAFAQFAASVPEYGLVLARDDCPATRRATAALGCRTETFGFGAEAVWSARHLQERGGRYSFEVFRDGRSICVVRLGVPGRHNVLNALAATALTAACGVNPEQIARRLSHFGGLCRRLELVGWSRGVAVLDDYAHHPTEVAATVETVRQMLPGRRLWCVFQPHQVCRTEHLLDELALSLQNVDRVLVADIFRAREPGPRSGEVTSADLARQIRRLGGDVTPVHTTREIIQLLETRLVPGDVLITVGAGDIRKVGEWFIDRFGQGCAAG